LVGRNIHSHEHLLATVVVDAGREFASEQRGEHSTVRLWQCHNRVSLSRPHVVGVTAKHSWGWGKSSGFSVFSIWWNLSVFAVWILFIVGRLMFRTEILAV